MELTVNSLESRDRAVSAVKQQFHEKKFIKVKITSGVHRSLNQNSLYYRWIADLVRDHGEMTAQEYRRFCKLEFFVPVLVLDEPHFAKMVNNCILPLDRPAQELAMDYMDVTSICTTRQMSEGMGAMQRHFASLQTKPCFLEGLEEAEQNQ